MHFATLQVIFEFKYSWLLGKVDSLFPISYFDAGSNYLLLIMLKGSILELFMHVSPDKTL